MKIKYFLLFLLLVIISLGCERDYNEFTVFEDKEVVFLDFELTNFKLDKPWEDLFLGYINVIKVDSTWHLWYETFNSDSKRYADPSFNTFFNYAYSNDGKNWIKPNLNLVDYNDLDNNILHFNRFNENQGIHGVTLFYDERAEYNEQFKMVYSKYNFIKNRGQIYGAVSSDGLKWKRERLLLDLHSDTQTSLFKHDDKYRLYFRYWNNKNGEKYRQIGYSSSKTFSNRFKKKESVEFLFENETNKTHFYTNAARSLNGKNVIIFPSIFDPGKNDMNLYVSQSSLNDYAYFDELNPVDLPLDKFEIIYAAPQSIEIADEKNTYWLYLSLNSNSHDGWRQVDDKYQGKIGRIKFKVIE